MIITNNPVHKDIGKRLERTTKLMAMEAKLRHLQVTSLNLSQVMAEEFKDITESSPDMDRLKGVFKIMQNIQNTLDLVNSEFAINSSQYIELEDKLFKLEREIKSESKERK